jgi:hypothetical protein
MLWENFVDISEAEKAALIDAIDKDLTVLSQQLRKELATLARSQGTAFLQRAQPRGRGTEATETVTPVRVERRDDDTVLVVFLTIDGRELHLRMTAEDGCRLRNGLRREELTHRVLRLLGERLPQGLPPPRPEPPTIIFP